MPLNQRRPPKVIIKFLSIKGVNSFVFNITLGTGNLKKLNLALLFAAFLPIGIVKAV
ncbi:MAG: hypothetical protein WCS87_03655 [Methylococcaceae bacterium]